MDSRKQFSSVNVVDCLFLFIFFSLIFYLQISERPLFVPDEGRYAEIAREMVVRHDFITPYLNEIRYFEKPVLFYWLSAISIKLFGVSIFSVRLINATLGILGIILTYFTAFILFNRKIAILAAAILATCPLYFMMSQMVSLDLTVTFFIAATLYFALIGFNLSEKKNKYFYLSAISSALAVLTKGLIGILFPGTIVLIWLIFTNNFAKLKECPLLKMIALFIVIALPWHILVALKNPGFLNFYFIEQQFLRYTEKGIGHYQPFWFFIPYFILGIFPWTIFFLKGFHFNLTEKRIERTERNNLLFLTIWVIFIFLFFSFSKSKLIPYILPLIPPVTVLTSYYLIKSIELKKFLSLKILSLLTTVLAISIGVFLFLIPESYVFNDPVLATKFLKLIAIILFSSAIISSYFSFINHSKSFITLFLGATIALLLITKTIPYLDIRTIKPLAEDLKTKLRPNDEVVTINNYFQDLPFYLERRVSILNWQNELTFGMKYADTKEWMLDDYQFLKIWLSNKRVYGFIYRDKLKQFEKRSPWIKYYIYNQTVNNVVITNRPFGSDLLGQKSH